jgi:hypothetical protein
MAPAPITAVDEPDPLSEEDAVDAPDEYPEDVVDDSGGDDFFDEDDCGGDGDSNGPWETVATFWQPPHAHVARIRLEQADIPCVLLDENLIATDWFFANAIGGIKLKVPSTDAVRARQLLSPPDAPPESDEPLFDGQVLCPRCGSDRHHPQRVSRRLAFLSILLLGAPLPIFARHNRCEACGETWR